MKLKSGQSHTLKKVLLRLKRYWGLMIGALLLALLQVVLTLYIPVLVGDCIDLMIGPQKVDLAAVARCLVRIGLCAGGSAVAQWLMSELNNHMTYRISRDIRNEAFRHIQRLPLRYLDRQPKGDLISRVIADVDTFADGLLMGFTQLFTGVMTIGGTLLFMLRINWKIALVVIVITPLSLLVANFIAKKTYSLFRQQSATRGEQTALIDETVGNLKLVKAFGHEDASAAAFTEVNERLKKCSLKAIFYSSLVNPATRFVNSLVYAGVGLVGALVAVNGGITVGILSTFLNYANQYTKPFNEISGVLTELQNALASAGRVFDLIDEPAYEPEAQPRTAEPPVDGGVEIENLNFSYVPDRKLIQDLNLKVQPGQRIAIVGPTGCGKTTVINLLMRFYDPDGGQICFDGIDTRKLPRPVLRRSVGMVLQETWLRSGTIRDNIAMGKPDATEEEVIRAAKSAYAHSFIMRLPEGYGTVLDEAGGGLSQGQKQLLCIARVMLCLPPMLFLDEATSSIDTRTEQRIQKAFSVMMEGRTTFIVAHRLSTVEEADQILVMRNGRVIEQGNHKQLLKKQGFYAELYKSQFAH